MLSVLKLKMNKELPANSPLRFLRPMLDKHGLLRVGGRLQHAGMTEIQKHPLILHRKSPLVHLILLDHHLRSLHSGPTTTLSLMLRTHHVIGAKRLAKDLSKYCVICQRSYARTTKQVMAPLPPNRVTPSPPFSQVGVDFAGPIIIRRGHTRKPLYEKAYICVYICLATKAGWEQ